MTAGVAVYFFYIWIQCCERFVDWNGVRFRLEWCEICGLEWCEICGLDLVFE